MFKVSFKDKIGSPSKMLQRKGNTTYVTLKGYMRIPEIYVPQDIRDWVHSVKSIQSDLYYNIWGTNGVATICVTGKAIKADADVDDVVFAERIAESRAKLKLYWFVYKLIGKILRYHKRLLYGNSVVRAANLVSDKNHDYLYKAERKYNRLLNTEGQHLSTLLHGTDNKSTD